MEKIKLNKNPDKELEKRLDDPRYWQAKDLSPFFRSTNPVYWNGNKEQLESVRKKLQKKKLEKKL